MSYILTYMYMYMCVCMYARLAEGGLRAQLVDAVQLEEDEAGPHGLDPLLDAALAGAHTTLRHALRDGLRARFVVAIMIIRRRRRRRIVVIIIRRRRRIVIIIVILIVIIIITIVVILIVRSKTNNR